MKTSSLWLLIFAGIVGIGIMGGIGMMGVSFALATTRVVHVDFNLLLKDPKGQPLSNTEVVVWEYDYPSQKAYTDSKGQVQFKGQSFQFVNLYSRTSQFFKKYPGLVSVRLHFPSLPEMQNVYYRFEVKRDGNISYNAFDSTYDYFFGDHWLGLFDEKGQKENTVTEGGDTYQATPPSTPCHCVPLWKAQALLSKEKKSGQSSSPNSFSLHLDLQAVGKKWIY